MADPVTTAKVNAAYDFMVEQKNEAMAQAPFFVRSKIDAVITPQIMLSRAYKLVAKIDKAEADASMKLSDNIMHPQMMFGDWPEHPPPLEK